MHKLTKTILEHGVENVYFIAKTQPLNRVLGISYTSSSDPEVEMLCKINTDRYKVEEGYKLTLQPIYDGFATEHYYVSDLESIIKRGHIKLLIQQPVENDEKQMKIERLERALDRIGLFCAGTEMSHVSEFVLRVKKGEDF